VLQQFEEPSLDLSQGFYSEGERLFQQWQLPALPSVQQQFVQQSPVPLLQLPSLPSVQQQSVQQPSVPLLQLPSVQQQSVQPLRPLSSMELEMLGENAMMGDDVYGYGPNPDPFADPSAE